MSLVEALVVPGAPLLVPEIAAGSAGADEPMRRTVRSAVTELLEAGDEPIVVLGSAPASGLVEGAWDWRGFGLAPRTPDRPRLPLALAIGDWLVDDVDPARSRRLLGVGAQDDAAACARRGAELVRDQDLRLLVVGDGSACRSEKAPGYLDPRAKPFDAAVERALGEGDAAALLALPVQLAQELLVAGRAPWQVLAGAAGPGSQGAQLLWSGAPHGVQYVVARWTAP